MDVIEKVSYVSTLFRENYTEIKRYIPSVSDVYIEKDYFADDFDLGGTPAELIVIVSSEHKANLFSSSLSSLDFRYFVINCLTPEEFSNPSYSGYTKVFSFEQD